MKQKFHLCANKIGESAEFISCLMLCVCTLAAFYGVLRRYVFNSPVNWVEEVSAISLVWMVLSYQFKLEAEDSQLSMSILFDRLPGGVKKVLTLTTNLIVILILGYLFMPAVNIVKRNYIMVTTTQGMNLPIWIAYLIMPLYIISVLLVRVTKIFFKNDNNTVL